MPVRAYRPHVKPKTKLTKRQKRTLLVALWISLLVAAMEYFMFGNILQDGPIEERAAIDYYHLALTLTFVSIYAGVFYVATGKLTIRSLFQSIAYGMFTGVLEDFTSAFFLLDMNIDKTLHYLSTSKWQTEVWRGVELGWIFGIPTWYVGYMLFFILVLIYRKRIPDRQIF